MLQVYGRKSSFNVQKVMWFVGELGLDYRHVELGGQFGGIDTPEFLKMNPHGRVPVIDDDRTIIWESQAILRYLAARYGQDQYWSSDPVERSHVDRWMDWSQCALQPTFLEGVFWGYYRTPKAKRNMAVVEAKIDATARQLGILDKILADKSYLLGDQLSLADIPAGTSLFRYFNIDIPRPALPNVERWYRLLEARPSYRTHVMVPFGELYGRLEH